MVPSIEARKRHSESIFGVWLATISAEGLGAIRSEARYAEGSSASEDEFFPEVNTVVALVILSVFVWSMLEDPFVLTAGDAAILEAASLLASTEDDPPRKAIKTTTENGPRHMNFPLLEQAEVCLSRPASAIVRMAPELFSEYEL